MLRVRKSRVSNQSSMASSRSPGAWLSSSTGSGASSLTDRWEARQRVLIVQGPDLSEGEQITMFTTQVCCPAMAGSRKKVAGHLSWGDREVEGAICGKKKNPRLHFQDASSRLI